MSQETKTTLLLSGIGILLVLIGVGIGFLSGALFNNWHFSFFTATSTPSSAGITVASSTSATATASSTSGANGTNGTTELQQGLSSSVPPMITASSASTTEPEEYTDVADWQLSQETSAGFTIMYPSNFTPDQGSASPTNDWRIDSQDPGIAVLSITVPPAVEPNTNFEGATVTVGYSENTSALNNCFVAPTGDSVSTSSASVNGIKFVVYTAESVGAGQQYTTTSYRTTHAGACYAVEYTIHTTNLSNFPAS
jgi:hypothetical protein